MIVLATSDAVAALSGERGFDRLAILRDPDRGSEAVDVRRYLDTVPGFAGFIGLPELREPGDWPGKAETQAFADLLAVITLLALLSALVLVSNTMTTLVAEQTGEIGIMRAVGARRRQVAFVYLRTAALVGLLGALVGRRVRDPARQSPRVLRDDVLGGRRRLRHRCRRGRRQHGSWACSLRCWPRCRRSGEPSGSIFARPSRSTGSRSGRRARAIASSAARAPAADGADRPARSRPAQAAQPRDRADRRLRGRNLLAVLALAAAARRLADVVVEPPRGRASLDERAQLFDASTADDRGDTGGRPGATGPRQRCEARGRGRLRLGVPREPLFRYRLSDGRWFSAAEERARERVAVIERNLAQFAGVEVGDRVTVTTVAGETPFRIVGMVTNQQEDGTGSTSR